MFCLCCRRGIVPRMAEDAALIVLVVQLRAIGTFALTGQKEDLGCPQHAQGWSYEIDPNSMPVPAPKCGANVRAGFAFIPDTGDSKAMYAAIKIAAKYRV